MFKPKVSIIIVNWNGKRFLRDCFDSLMAQTYRDFEVVFVDNDSKDESVSFVKEYFPETKIITLTDNLGFAEGNIIGYKYARGDYICLLNNDTKVSPIC